MKYKLTWKDIFIANSFRFIVIGFPIFIVLTSLVTLLIDFFTGEFSQYSFSSYIVGLYSAFPLLIVIYSCLILFIATMSFSHWRKNIIGEHELFMDEEFFIWKSSRQEVKTKLSLLKDFTVKRKHLIIKFDGIKKAKIEKNWILEGYDDFVADMTKVLSNKK